MNQKIITLYLIILFFTTACVSKKHKEDTNEQNIPPQTQPRPQKAAPKYNDRNFFFLRGNVKEVIFSYSYSDQLLNNQELEGMFENIKDMHICFNKAGLITRLYWEGTPYDYTLDEPDENGNFAASGDPKLGNEYYYYVPKLGTREDKEKEHILTIQLDQFHNGEVVGSYTVGCNATLYSDGTIEKLYNNLFSELGPGTDGAGINDDYRYVDSPDDLPTRVFRGVLYGGDEFLFDYKIQYPEKDEQGNWTKAVYSDTEKGSVELIITRKISYY